jgi:hypothetical protein
MAAAIVLAPHAEVEPGPGDAAPRYLHSATVGQSVGQFFIMQAASSIGLVHEVPEVMHAVCRSAPSVIGLLGEGAPAAISTSGTHGPMPLPVLKVKMTWHERNQNDAAHEWFREIIVRCAEGMHGGKLADEQPAEPERRRARRSSKASANRRKSRRR